MEVQDEMFKKTFTNALRFAKFVNCFSADNSQYMVTCDYTALIPMHVSFNISAVLGHKYLSECTYT